MERDCYPAIKITSVSLTVEGKDILAVEVPYSTKRPHFSGPAYIRVGSESKEASQEIYEELLTGHCGLAGQLIKIKNSNQIVTVAVINHVLGDPRPVLHIVHREHECLITAVTPTSLSLHDIGSDRIYSEPLNNIELIRDEMKHRPMLIVR